MSHEPILFTGVERQELDDFTVRVAQLPLGELEWLRRHHSLQPPDEVIAYIAAHWQELATLIASRLLEREPDAADAEQHRTFVRKTAFWRRKLALIEGEMERRHQAVAALSRIEEPAAHETGPPRSVTPIEVRSDAPTDSGDAAAAASKATTDSPPGPPRRSGHWRPATQPPAVEPHTAPAETRSRGNGSKAADARLVNELSTVATGERGAESEPA